MTTHHDTVTSRQWLYCIAAILCLKLILLMLDPLPMFFLGDSQTYLGTALHLWIPPDRSFVYGLFVRLVAVTSGSLSYLVLTQVLLSGGSAFIITFLLVRFFGTTFRYAFALGLLCAVEPLQLLYERYVMTETLSLFIFALYLLSICYYLQGRYLKQLFIVQAIGTALISVRLSFLPIVACFAVVVPLLRLQAEGFCAKPLKNRRILMSVCNHLLFSTIVTLCLHSAYKHLNGYLVKGPPAYQYQSGMFLAADFAPAISPIDFPYPKLAPAVFSNLKFDMADRSTRGPQRWMDGGLITNINNVIPDPIGADEAAKKTAMNAFKRDPIAIALLGLQGYCDYWSSELLKRSMITDKGSDRELPPEMLTSLKKHFRLNAAKYPFADTITGGFFFAAWPWYLLLLCLPLLAGIALVLARTTRDKGILLFLASSAIVLTASLLIERPTVRYLHPLGWMCFLIVGTALAPFTRGTLRPKEQQ